MISSISILDRKDLEGIPSVSGIEIVGDGFFVISDNSPWLFQLNNKYEIVDTIPVVATDKNLEGNIFKKLSKPDFEGMAFVDFKGKNEIFIFGSGSKSPERNSLVRTGIEDNDSVVSYQLDEFYQKILSITELSEKDLNIEGIAVKNNKMYVFNRGNNAIWEYDLMAFINYLENNKNCPAPIEYLITLPEYKGVKAGFSGATSFKSENKIIFTASLEDTKNWIDDGEVLGSYVGIIELDSLANNYIPAYIPITEKDSVLPIKVESVGIFPPKEKEYVDVILVTDSDGGASEIIKARLNFQE